MVFFGDPIQVSSIDSVDLKGRERFLGRALRVQFGSRVCLLLSGDSARTSRVLKGRGGGFKGLCNLP